MRISGGRARGICLQCPKNSVARPATGKVREAIFSSLGNKIIGCTFLDLFAGIGSYGLEALSRGASSGIFVENDRKNVETIRLNLAAVAKSAGVSSENFFIRRADVFSIEIPAADILFIDPPYDLFKKRQDDLWQIIEKFVAHSTTRDCHIVLESPSGMELNIPPTLKGAKIFGNSGSYHSPRAVILRPKGCCQT